jgi:hypothetical protein
MTDWKDKNVGFLSKKGSSRKTPVVNEDDGSHAGYHVDHWDDRRDAVAQPRPVDLTIKVKES